MIKRDEKIFELIQKEHERQMDGIELIASENFVSPQVMEAMGSVMTNKYAEGLPGARYYGGCQIVDQSERDRKSTRLNSSHVRISYAVFCLKKKKRTYE